MPYVLKLYITGKTPRSEQAIKNLEDILDKPDLSEEYELTIVDLLENPEVAEKEKIMATPTLVKELPPPVRRVIGDLSIHEKVYFALDIVSKAQR